MWCSTPLAIVIALIPVDAGGLTLSHVRMTYGMLGPTRQDNHFLPSDDVVLCFDIDGAKANAAGKILYAIGMDVTDSKGKVQFRQLPNDREADAPPDGKGLPACARVQIGSDQEPGSYRVHVTVTDRVAGATREISQTCQVLPKAFGLVHLTTTSDYEGKLPRASFEPGKPGWINFDAAGFGRAKSTGQPHVSVVLRVSDDAGRPALAKPSMGEVTKDVPANAAAVPMQFALEINRAGRFTVQLTATDQVTGKTASVSFPLTVTKAK